MATRPNPNGEHFPTRHHPNGEHFPSRPQPNGGRSHAQPNGDHALQPPAHAAVHPLPPPSQRPYRPRSASSSSSASFKGCCCCLLLLLTFLVLLLVAMLLVVFLVVKPKKPQFDLQQVGVQYLIVTPSFLSLNITMLFTASNPNKVGIKYIPSTFFVMYRGVPMGLASVPSFYQPAHSTRTVRTRATIARVNVLQLDALDLIRDATVNDRVELRVTGDVGAKIRLFEINSPRVKVTVDCAIVISPKKQMLTYKQCGVDGLSV